MPIVFCLVYKLLPGMHMMIVAVAATSTAVHTPKQSSRHRRKTRRETVNTNTTLFCSNKCRKQTTPPPPLSLSLSLSLSVPHGLLRNPLWLFSPKQTRQHQRHQRTISVSDDDTNNNNCKSARNASHVFDVVDGEHQTGWFFFRRHHRLLRGHAEGDGNAQVRCNVGQGKKGAS